MLQEENTLSFEHVVGVDVHQASFVCRRIQGEVVGDERTIGNCEQGIDDLLDWSAGGTLIVEATSSLHFALVERALERGTPIAVVRGYKVREFARSQMRAKTDAADALMIARYGQVSRPTLAVRWDQARRQLKELLSKRRGIARHRASCKQMHASKELMKAFAGELKALDENIQALALAKAESYRRLMSIPGVGRLTAAALLVFLWDEEQVPGKAQLTSFVGLDVTVHASANSRRKGHISKQGDPNIRRLLFLAAMAAMRMRRGAPHALYLKLRLRLPTHAAICALGRKLLHTARSLVKYQMEFDHERFLNP